MDKPGCSAGRGCRHREDGPSARPRHPDAAPMGGVQRPGKVPDGTSVWPPFGQEQARSLCEPKYLGGLGAGPHLPEADFDAPGLDATESALGVAFSPVDAPSPPLGRARARHARRLPPISKASAALATAIHKAGYALCRTPGAQTRACDKAQGLERPPPAA
ncbi:hypothetical protein amb4027 [Paramagnetospirillum magneticum AMB-1]|uniref:Uncharacterized protein n=1 Tax=Paramagnetospirillum magneticum (strain ATCC 700264 / AMB-1) TaxID=342108 RepID=Q2VZZ4_PARM1|nr:hypothetical protein amb4027 [Paramagnetospirillum magneticum AMB-1]